MIEQSFRVSWRWKGEFAVVPHPTVLAGEQVYSHQALEEAEGFLEPLYAFAKQQSVDLTSVLPEYGPGQFEVNLRHRSDPLHAADEYLLAKRVTKAAAESLNKSASFMALPSSEAAGNGCHIHISFADKNGENLFADETRMQAAAQGVLANVGDCVALLAPTPTVIASIWAANLTPRRRLGVRTIGA